jgi:CP family cyanate transporter-like MFS transporter
VWAALLGVGQGTSFALALLLIALRAPDTAAVTSLSAVSQTAGYVLAAVGPLLIGIFREMSGGWTVPLLLVLAACALQVLIGAGAARAPAPDRE